MVCGWTKKLLTKRDGGMKVSSVEVDKMSVWEAWKKRKASKKEYMVARKACKHAVCNAKKEAEKKKFACVKQHIVKFSKLRSK